jgi:hypothetical protein
MIDGSYRVAPPIPTTAFLAISGLRSTFTMPNSSFDVVYFKLISDQSYRVLIQL